MDSANLQFPDQLVGSPPNLAAPSCFGFGSNLPWSSSPPTATFTNITSVGDSNPNYGGSIVSNSSTTRKHSTDHECHRNNLTSDHSTGTHSNLIHDHLGFPWSSSSITTTTDHESAYNDQLDKIKEEFSEISFPKFSEMLNSPSINNSFDDYENFHFIKNQNHHNVMKDNFRDHLSCCSNTSSNSSTTTTDLDHQNPTLVKTNNLSSNRRIHGADHHHHRPELDCSNGTTTTTNSSNNSSSSSFGGLAVGCRGQFSQIYPSVNISNLTSQYSNLMAMNFIKPGLDPRFHNMGGTNCSTFGQPLSNFGVDSVQQQAHRLSCGRTTKAISSFNSEITEAKRPNSTLMEQKTSSQNKKLRSESRSSSSSCPPFKVRKEKLGDRIAALQQLVSPFGKTDTASVLMEAIGYIKFLQNQVETLSVPYMKSSRNKTSKTMQGGLKDQDGSDEEPQRDLKSRGLCLVPLSCMSYVTGDGGTGSLWPPMPNFGGRIT